jgi:hypothetical protein
MKLLSIEQNKGNYLHSEGHFATIDKITKEDLLRLVDLTLEEREVEFDPYSGDAIQNQAHQIIYKSIYEKLCGLRARRQEFKDESDRLYLTEYDKYRDNSSETATTGDEECPVVGR